jgi:hypothetical protein
VWWWRWFWWDGFWVGGFAVAVAYLITAMFTGAVVLDLWTWPCSVLVISAGRLRGRLMYGLCGFDVEVIW